MKLFSKFLAVLTTLVLLSCPLFSALADSQLTPSGQVVESMSGEKWFYDTNGQKVTATQLGQNDALVQVSKWVQSAGNENEFEVTLNVTTEEDLTTLSESQDAAVLFVLDNSSSMNNAMGKGDRLSTLKEVANTFLNTFANQTGAEPGDQRLAAAVVFNGSATLHMPWLDLCKTTNENGVEKSNLNLAQARIDAIPKGSGTNIEAGMHLAASYMNYHKTAANGKLKNVDFLYTILITDGEPSNCSPYDENYLSQYNGNDNIVFKAASPSTDMGVFDRVDTIGDAAADIKKLSALSEIYGVCMSVGESNLLNADPTEEQQQKLNPTFSGKIQIGKWFQLFSDKYFSVSDGNVDELENAFGQIASKIQVGTSAFRLKDVMGPHIRYDGPSNASDQNVIEKDGNAFLWDLRKSPREEKKVTSSNTETTIYEYQYKYKTSLNNLAATLTAATATPVNDDDDTRLEYIATKDGRWQTNTLYQVGLPVPTVQGYAAELNFTKHDYTGKPLAGAVFTLSHNKTNCSCGLNTTWEATATSTTDGSVHFSGIPSGHTYSMTEVPPEGHASPGVQTVTTALGEATLTGAGVAQAGDGSYTLTNEQDIGKTGKLIIKKTFSGHSEPEGVVFAVEKTTPEGINYSTTVTLNAANSWTVTLQGIPSGTYSVKEQLSDATFENYDHKVTVEVDNQAVTPSTADGFTGVTLKVPENGETVEAHFTNTYTPHTGKVIIRKTITQTGEKNYLKSNGPTDLQQIKSALKYVIGDAAGSTVKSLAYSVFEPVSGEDYVEYSIVLPVGKYTLLETDYKHSRYFDTVENFSYTLTDGQNKFHVAQGDTISGYITSESLPVYVDKDETVSIHYSNNYVLKAGQLEIRKFFHGIPDELKKPANAGKLSFAYQHNSYETVKGSVAYTSFGNSSSHSGMHGSNYRYYLPDAPVGEYTVTEQNRPDYSAQGYRYVKTEYSQEALKNFKEGSEGVSSSVQPGGKGTIFFVNTYVPQGKLTIRKQITGDLNDAEIAELLNTLTFTVKNSSGSVSGTYSAKGAIEGSDGWYVIQTGIALDEGTYTVTETGDSVALFDHTCSVSVASAAAKTTANGNTASVTLSHDDWDNPAVVSFTNDYAYQTTSAVLSGSKVLENRAFLASDSFAFTLAAETAGAPMPAKTSVTVLPTQNASFTFDSITYTKRHAGNSYTYLVSETAGSIPGVTYDTAKYKATVTVSETNGALSTSTAFKKVDSTGAETDASDIVFTNVYTSQGSLTLNAVKKLTGRTLEEEQFSFELRNADGNVVQTVTNAADGSITFEEITYTQADLANSPIEYSISEVAGASDKGYTYDATTHTITVTLEDNGDGTITATADKTGVNVPFINTYEAEGSVTLSAHKTLTGRTLANEQFSFQLKRGDTVIETVKNDANGIVTFSSLNYTLTDLPSSPITYTIVELDNDQPGYICDTAPRSVIVTLVDNGDGTITATPDKTGIDVTFANSYAASGSATLTASKTLAGRELQDGQFSFELKDSTGNVIKTAKNDANGNIVFSPISYNEADAGKTYTYTVSEVNVGKTGYTYDTTVYQIAVTIGDNGNGTLNVSYTVDGDANKPMVFSNSYLASGEVGLSAYKQLNGRALSENQFSFTLADASGNTLQTKFNTAAGDIIFDKLTFSQADMVDATLNSDGKPEKQFTYTISEVVGEEPGYSYDTAAHTVIVTLVDNGDGSITATADKTGIDVTFTNTYEAKGSYRPTATKTLSGRTLTDKQFSFELVGTDGQVLQTVTNDADGNISFSPINYTEADAGKTYTYTVSEVNAGADGYTYDGSIYTITVEVIDDGKGGLTATPTIKKGEQDVEAITFANSYAASGSATLTASKTLTGRELQDGQFSFELKDSTGNVIKTAKNDADGNISFFPINYTEADAGKTYTYTVSEVNAGADGYTYDGSIYTITVEVIDDGKGGLTATPTIKKGEQDVEAITFANSYAASGSATLTASKALTGRELQDGQFSFELVGTDGQLLQTKTNNATGLITFDALTYDQTDVDDSFTYTIREVKGNANGYTYDGTEYTVTVTVKDNGNGTLSAEATVPGEGNAKLPATSQNITFANVYTVTPTTYTPKAAKQLTGEEPTQTSTFTFTLTADESNLAGGAQLSGTTATVTGAGEASFGEITFLKAGTYCFTIAENDSGVKGYYYDKAGWLLTVVVEDVDSQLTVKSHSYVQQMTEGLTSDEKATFTNVFSVTAVPFTPAVTKAVTGVPLRDECHQFTIRQTSTHPDGSIVMPADKTASVTGAGQAVFEEILFLRKGVYTFAITEMAGDDPACTYDSSEWTLTVTVTETDSVLSASGAYSCNGQAGDPVFNNHYQPGGLLITKEVTGSQGDRLQPFTFVVNVMYNGEMHDSTYTWQIVSPSWPGPMSGTIANGGCVKLRHGQSVMLYGLPAGASYEVVELEADLNGYVTVAENATGIIAADAAQTVSFFNHCMLPDPPTTGDPAQPMLYAVLSLLGLLGLCVLRRKRC